MGNPGRRRLNHRPELRHRSGYSLLELVITILVLGIIASVATPRLVDSLAGYRADSAAARIVADLALAQKHARTTGTSETVTFDRARNRYSFSSITDSDRGGIVYEVDLTNYPYDAQLTRLKLTSGESITFDGFGFVNGGGKLKITTDGVSRIIVIDAATGSAQVEGG